MRIEVERQAAEREARESREAVNNTIKNSSYNKESSN